MPSIGFSTRVPSGSRPSRSNDPEEKWSALCPCETIAQRLPGLGQPDAAGHAGQASADDYRIEFHFAAVFCVSSDNPHTLS